MEGGERKGEREWNKGRNEWRKKLRERGNNKYCEGDSKSSYSNENICDHESWLVFFFVLDLNLFRILLYDKATETNI